MMKKKPPSRLLSALLALVILLSVFPGQAFATGQGESLTETISAVTESEALPEEKAPTKSGADYLALLDSLRPLVPVNELVDLTEYVFLNMDEHDRITELNGLYYFVTQVTEGDETVYYIMDPSSPTIHERVAATPVTIVGNTVVGADPEMALELIHDTTAQGNNRWEHRIKLRGDYDDLEKDYYLTPSLDADSSALCRTKSILDFGLALRQGPEDEGRESLYFYRSLSYTGEDGETVVGSCHICYATDIDGNRYFHRAPLPEVFGEGNLFKVYRLLTDRVNVENLLDMLSSLRDDLPFNEKYDQETYDSFLSAVQEAMDLYTAYNGRVFSEAEADEKASAQAQVDSLTSKLMSLRSLLRISKNTGNQGSEIRYVDSTVYRWNETNMNKLTMELEDYAKKGFFFTGVNSPGTGKRPYFSQWNAKKAYENLQGPDGKELQATVQQWGIHSGLTKKDLNGSLDPLDPNIAVSADLWGKESIDGAKSVYTKVGLPFVYDIETGYYEMNSDKNAVFFGEEPESGAKMVIADRPCAYSLNASGFEVCEDPQTYVYADPTTHKVYDRYIAGFQPFSPVTPFEWKSFPGDASYTGGIDSLTPAYLLDGISWISQAVPDPNPNDFGTATWGFGMMVEFTFRMTESGTIIYTDASGARHEVPITFEFSGDDDIWVYIDDKLAMDIGGTHDAIQGRIDFQTGNVTLRSDKFERIIDLHGFYTQNREDTGYTYSSSESILGEMYEENIYTGKIGPETAESAAEGRRSSLADGKDHVMRIYYMDRGKGKTNCAIRFNLPKTDILTVEKKIDPHYHGDSSKDSLPTALYENLTKKIYTFTLLENGEPVSNMPYYLTRNGSQVGSGVTGGDGRFTLRGDQIAEFRSMNFTASKVYSIEEVGLSSTYWGEERYTYSYSGAGTSASGTENSYAAPGDTASIETLSFVCTNVYIHTLNLDPDPQAVVLDYGKPIEVEVVRNAVVTGASEIWVRQAKVLSLSFADSSDSRYGTTKLLDKDGDGKMESFRFTLTKMLDKVVTIYAKLEIPFEDGSVHTVDLPVHMIPATQVYYETDFAQNIFTLTTKGTDKLWQSFGTPQEELQDEGNVDDQLYDLYIDRDNIPSNAFFTDFDGRGMEERYQKHLLYTGYDFDQPESYISTDQRISSLGLNAAAGIMEATLGVNSEGDTTYYSRYIHTGIPGATNARSRPLNFVPGANDYLQMRFRLENCEVETGKSYFGVALNVLCSDDPDSIDISDKTSTIVLLKEQHADLMAGKFVTATIPLADYQRYTQATNIEAFSFHIEHVKIKDNTTAKIYYDYIYVGPLTEENGVKGQNHEVGADALFFDFKNDASATLRYSGSQYGDISKDTNTYWTATYSPSNSKTSPTITTSGDGYVTLNVSTTQHGSNHKTGPYLYMTNKKGEIGAADGGYSSYWPLNYVTPKGKLYYIVRASFKNVKFSKGGASDTEPYIQMSIIGKDVNNSAVYQHPRHPLKAGEINNKGYLEFKLDVTSYVSSMKTIEAIYVRFTNLAPSGSSNGSILVDYLYLGPEETPDKVRQMQEESIYFGFNNTNADKQRYSGTMYSGINYDLKTNWSYENDWFYLETTGNGVMKLTPNKQATHESGYGSVYPLPNDSSKLNYTLTGNDHIQMRVKFVNVKQYGDKAPNAKVFFGSEDAPFTTAGQKGYDYDANQKLWTLNKEDVESGKWITLTFNLADHTWVKGRPDTIRFLFPAFQQIKIETGGYILIDYIYLGSLTDGKPKCESLFFGFENEEIDQARYESDTYSNHNYDLLPATGDTEGWTTDPALNSSNRAYTIDNEIGLLTLEVTDKLSTEDIRGPYLTTSDLYDHDNNRSANQYTVEYIPANAEYMQIRFRINNCKTSENATKDINVVFLYDGYDKEGSYVDFDHYNGGAYIRGYYETEDDFQVLTMPLTDAIREMTLISNFGIRFQHMSSDGGGTVDIDYIYVGPGELAPDPVYGYDSSYEDATYPEDVLFFGFENEEGDRQRYESEIYAGLNYDFVDHSAAVGYWGTNRNVHTDENYAAFDIDSQAGILKLEVTDKALNETKGPFLITLRKYKNYGLSEKNASLHYPTASAELLRVRFRFVDCESDGEKQTELQLMSRGLAYDGSYYDPGTVVKDITVTSEYQVMDFALDEYFSRIEFLTNMGLRFRNVCSATGGLVEIDYIYIGPEKLAPPKEGEGKVAEFSNGSTYFVEGSGVKLNDSTKTYTEASFHFTGTGFDLISRTGMEQATLRVEVRDEGGNRVKTVSINNKGDMELSQIPVVSVHGLPHGAYTVFIWVNKGLINNDYPIFNRGDQFFFDALRIYDPIDVSREAGLLTTQQRLSREAYEHDKEAHDYIKEIRDTLLAVADFDDVTFGNSTAGALFVDGKNISKPGGNDGSQSDPSGKEDMVIDHLAVQVRDYNKVGPKNEVYLSPGEAVAFKLVLSATQKPVSIDIGAKTILTDEGTLAAGFVSVPRTSSDALSVLSIIEEKLVTSTAMYYALDVNTLPASEDVYLIIHNAYTGTEKTRNVLSITDLKIAYEERPTELLPEDDTVDTDTEIRPEKRNQRALDEPYSFEADSRTLEAAGVFMNAVLERHLAETPVVEDEIGLYHNLNLASDIALNYLVPKTELQSYDSFCLEARIPYFEDNGEVTYETLTIHPEDRGGEYYYFTLEGLTAVNMNDVIQARIRMEKDGTEYNSPTDEYSISEYAYAQLNKEEASPELKTLCADLLRYGAKAQIFKGYRTDSLADRDMTEEHRAYLSHMEAVSFGNTNEILEDLPSAPLTWVGKTLNLESKVSLKFVFDMDEYDGNSDELHLRVNYMGIDGETVHATVWELEEYNATRRQYAFSFDGLLAAELRNVVSVQIYAGDSPVSATLQYSPDTYGNNKTGTLLDLCKALFAYSDSARAYFA